MGLVRFQEGGLVMHWPYVLSIVNCATCSWYLIVHPSTISSNPSWALEHVMYEGKLFKLKIDSTSGARFASKSTYIFGKETVQIQLILGDSAGTVTTFYMSSQGDQHDEFDFEFLGNTYGEPYAVQANVYSKGVGNREQRIFLWFDPTVDFNSSGITSKLCDFFVDDVPIQVFLSNEKVGVLYPQTQPMVVYSSIWNIGQVTLFSTYKFFSINACEYSSTMSYSSWWDQPSYASLDGKQRLKLKWVQEKYVTYD